MAGAGTATFYSYNMESEIEAAKAAGYGMGGSFEDDKKTKTLYHYTNEKGMKGIVEWAVPGITQKQTARASLS